MSSQGNKSPKKKKSLTINSITHYRTYSMYNDYDDTVDERQKKTAFPAECDHCGFLDFKSRATKPWQRKFFVLSNNFLLIGATPHSTKLDRVIPLEGSNVKQSQTSQSLMFQIKRYQFRAPNKTECNLWVKSIAKASKLKIKDIYQFKQLLGTNVNGTTKVMSAKHRVNGTFVAVKQISKKAYNPRILSNEVLILKRLDHPNVVKLHDVFETKKHVYLVMEKCNGGELFELIARRYGTTNNNNTGFTEQDSVKIMHQIAKAIKYMHSMGIVHRDLKPENILCSKQGSFDGIKIADFGISKVLFDPEQRRLIKERIKWMKLHRKSSNTKNTNNNNNNDNNNIILKQKRKSLMRNRSSNSNTHDSDDEKKDNIIRSRPVTPKTPSKKKIDPWKKKKRSTKSNNNDHLMRTMCGTISYTAPEILKEQPYDYRVDYWSLGVIMFILLCGYPPFFGDNEVEAAQSILFDKIEFDNTDWKHISDNGKNLVKGLLQKNPRHRYSVDDILSHTWTFTAKNIQPSTNSQKNLMKTVALRRIRKNSMSAFEKNMKRMNKIYRSIDDTRTLSRKNSDIFSAMSPRSSKTEDDLMELRLPQYFM